MEELASRRNRGTSKASAGSDTQNYAVQKPSLSRLITTLNSFHLLLEKKNKAIQRLYFTQTLLQAHSSKGF